ncbi:MAG: MerR family DNA-binding transcriptional regulator [Hyphomicrobiales bacterium]
MVPLSLWGLNEMSDKNHDTPQNLSSLEDGQDRRQTRQSSETVSEYAIGELAREFKTTLRTLRFYEDKGLLHPRRVGLQRIYSQQDRERLKLIVIGKRVGLSLEEIATMLEVYQLPKAEAGQLLLARDSMNSHIDLLRERQSDIDQALTELHRTIEVVTGMLKAKQQERLKT